MDWNTPRKWLSCPIAAHTGKIVRLSLDDNEPGDIRVAVQQEARDEIWPHIQAAAFHPSTNELWVAEMGPGDGDELNRRRRWSASI